MVVSKESNCNENTHTTKGQIIAATAAGKGKTLSDNSSEPLLAARRTHNGQPEQCVCVPDSDTIIARPPAQPSKQKRKKKEKEEESQCQSSSSSISSQHKQQVMQAQEQQQQQQQQQIDTRCHLIETCCPTSSAGASVQNRTEQYSSVRLNQYCGHDRRRQEKERRGRRRRCTAQHRTTTTTTTSQCR